MMIQLHLIICGPTRSCSIASGGADAGGHVVSTRKASMRNVTQTSEGTVKDVIVTGDVYLILFSSQSWIEKFAAAYQSQSFLSVGFHSQ